MLLLLLIIIICHVRHAWLCIFPLLKEKSGSALNPPNSVYYTS